MKRLLFSILALVFGAPLGSMAAVNFPVTYEPGSKWLTESYSAQARANLEQLLSDIGSQFAHTASIEVLATDNETSAFASAGAGTYEFVTLSGKIGEYVAPGVWIEITTGTDPNGSAYDCTINWNFDLALYEGLESRLLNNIRGLSRHEIMHPLGMSGRLFHDSRGLSNIASIQDAMLVDYNGAPLLGAYNPTTKRFVVNPYALDPAFGSATDQSGIRFQSITPDGSIELQQLAARSGSIDFSHVAAIAYVYARPGGSSNWDVILEEDINYLRGLGYQMVSSSPWEQWYTLADQYYLYYTGIGDSFSAAAYYYYYRGYGDYVLNLDANNLASADYGLYYGLALYYYYTYGGNSTGLYYYYYYLAYAYYNYFARLGDITTANYYWNTYITAANDAL